MGGRTIFKKNIGSVFIKKGVGSYEVTYEEASANYEVESFFKYLVQCMLISIWIRLFYNHHTNNVEMKASTWKEKLSKRKWVIKKSSQIKIKANLCPF